MILFLPLLLERVNLIQLLMYKKSDIVLSKNGNYITINNSPDYEKVFVSTSPGKSPEDIIKEAQNNIDKLYL